MNLKDALALTGEYLERYIRFFVLFFKKDADTDIEISDYREQIIVGGLIYLILGVTIQDSILRRIKIDDITWFERALVQIIFWITIGLLLHITLRMLKSSKNGQELVVNFRVMPVAFLAGCYASSLGVALTTALNFWSIQFPALPSIFHIVTQISILILFLPKKLQVATDCGIMVSIIASGIVVIAVCFVDLFVVFGSAFIDFAPTSQ